MGALRLSIPAADAGFDVDEALFEVLAGIPSSWTREAGDLLVWVDESDGGQARDALSRAGFARLSVRLEGEHDWVEEAAALQKAVVVGRYLLDPHDGARATDAGPRDRLFVPARRAFGTGSHESTRLALRLLLDAGVAGRSVLDVGCGTGTLAFVAAREGASRVVAFDLDPDAAFATRDVARENGIDRIECFAGPLDALSRSARFDVVVANMIHEELAPLLSGLRDRLAPGGRILTSGQLVARRDEWAAVLGSNGFAPRRFESEGDWLGTDAATS